MEGDVPEVAGEGLGICEWYVGALDEADIEVGNLLVGGDGQHSVEGAVLIGRGRDGVRRDALVGAQSSLQKVVVTELASVRVRVWLHVNGDIFERGVLERGVFEDIWGGCVCAGVLIGVIVTASSEHQSESADESEEKELEAKCRHAEQPFGWRRAARESREIAERGVWSTERASRKCANKLDTLEQHVNGCFQIW